MEVGVLCREGPGGVFVEGRLGDGWAGPRGVGDGRRNFVHRDAVQTSGCGFISSQHSLHNYRHDRQKQTQKQAANDINFSFQIDKLVVVVMKNYWL